MSRFINTAALVGSLAALASAHGRIESITAGGKEYEGYINDYNYGKEIPSDLVAWSAENGDNGFVDGNDYGNAANIACHINGKPGGGAAQVAAGDKVTLQWGPDTWPESHHGPVIDYLAKCAGDDCSSVSAGDLSFFKIDEAGLVDGSSSPGQWASDDLIADGNKWEVTIPESLAPGQYVLRHEIIALHSAGDTNGAQNYPQCINLEVSGSGSASPSGVTADKLYTADEAGIKTNIYTAPISYEIPGPELWDGASSGGSSSGGSSSGGNSSDSSPAATSSVVAAAPSTVASSSSAASETSVAAAAAPTSYGSGGDAGAAYPTTTSLAVATSAAAPPTTAASAGAVTEAPDTPSAPAASAPSGAPPAPTQAYGNAPSGRAGGNGTAPQPPSPGADAGPEQPCEEGQGPAGSFGGAAGGEGPHASGPWRWFSGHGEESRKHSRDIMVRRS